MNITLSDRQRRLLALVVHDFVQTAQPVASGALVRQHDLAFSSATVRHELAALEDMGLLTQPHTSSGRVPTVAGYRYFVEELMHIGELPQRDRRAIRQRFQQVGGDLDRVMRLSAAVVARVSGVAGLAAAWPSHAAPPEPQLYHAGLAQILYAPEFATADHLRGIVELLEHGEALEPILGRLPPTGVQVIIGGEPPLERTPYLTLVLARFGQPALPCGVLGVVGPTRLPYERAVSCVSFVARVMNQLLTGQAVP